MPGFPTRITANAIGPRMVNRGLVRDPKRDVSAERMNLMRWQIAGLGQAVPLAWVVSTFVPPNQVELAAHGAAWQGPAPQLERIDPGVYLVTYAVSYADEGGVLVPTNLLGASVSVRAHVPPLRGEWEIQQARKVLVALYDKNDVPTDGSFLLHVF